MRFTVDPTDPSFSFSDVINTMKISQKVNRKSIRPMHHDDGPRVRGNSLLNQASKALILGLLACNVAVRGAAAQNSGAHTNLGLPQPGSFASRSQNLPALLQAQAGSRQLKGFIDPNFDPSLPARAAAATESAAADAASAAAAATGQNDGTQSVVPTPDSSTDQLPFDSSFTPTSAPSGAVLGTGQPSVLTVGAAACVAGIGVRYFF